jgi:hypothetical protein
LRRSLNSSALNNAHEASFETIAAGVVNSGTRLANYRLRLHEHRRSCVACSKFRDETKGSQRLGVRAAYLPGEVRRCCAQLAPPGRRRLGLGGLPGRRWLDSRRSQSATVHCLIRPRGAGRAAIAVVVEGWRRLPGTVSRQGKPRASPARMHSRRVPARRAAAVGHVRSRQGRFRDETYRNQRYRGL